MSDLSLVHIHKRFGSNVALMDASLEVEKGEIHAILGENGAGKTTLMNILFGLLVPDRGEMRLGGQPYSPSSPSEAKRLGIGMVHQHFMLVPTLTVGQNILLGEKPFDRFHPTKSYGSIQLRMEALGFPLPLEERTESLSVGERQRVEIFRALWKGARVLILDEPTAVLTPQEIDGLCNLLVSLRNQGVTILFISHKLEEIEKLCDRVTILRKGRTVGSFPVHETPRSQLSRLVLGREVETVKRARPTLSAHSLERDSSLARRKSSPGLTIRCTSRGPKLFGDWRLEAPKGEITAIAGVEGNGQRELAEAILGISSHPGIDLLYEGKRLPWGVRNRIEWGLGFISEDRQNTGLVLDFTIQENLAFKDISRPPWSWRGWLTRGPAVKRAIALINRYQVHPPNPSHPAASLSGGNQQKVVVAREISREHRLLVATNPTRGLDVGACQAVHKALIEDADRGAAVLLFTTDLDEALQLADRLAILYRGQVTLIPQTEWTVESLGLAMLGVAATKVPA